MRSPHAELLRPRRGRPLAELVVTAEDRATLERWMARRKTAQGLALRAQIVLRCGSGSSNSEVRENCASPTQRLASGARGLSPKAWPVCWTSRGVAHRGGSPTIKWRR